jgi:hypothetical protein
MTQKICVFLLLIITSFGLFKIIYFNCLKAFKDLFKYNLTLVLIEFNEHHYLFLVISEIKTNSY